MHLKYNVLRKTLKKNLIGDDGCRWGGWDGNELLF